MRKKRSVIGQIDLLYPDCIFFRKVKDRIEFELFGRKTPELNNRLTMLAMVVRSAGIVSGEK